MTRKVWVTNRSSCNRPETQPSFSLKAGVSHVGRILHPNTELPCLHRVCVFGHMREGSTHFAFLLDRISDPFGLQAATPPVFINLKKKKKRRCWFDSVLLFKKGRRFRSLCRLRSIKEDSSWIWGCFFFFCILFSFVYCHLKRVSSKGARRGCFILEDVVHLKVHCSQPPCNWSNQRSFLNCQQKSDPVHTAGLIIFS